MADLPVAIGKRAFDGGLHLVAVERCQGQHRSTTHGWFVLAGGDDHRDGAVVADGAERGNGCFTNEGVRGLGGQGDQRLDHVVAVRFLFAAGPRGHLDDPDIAVAERIDEVDLGVCRSDLGGAAADTGVGVVQRGA